MSFFFKINRRLSISLNNFYRYSIYAIGEIAIIIIGILFAVNINNWNDEKKERIERCLYLEELHSTIIADTADVVSNIRAFDVWNNKIQSLIDKLKKGTIIANEELYDEFGTVGNYIYFKQQSKSKIDQLTYSQRTLVPDRKLKDQLLDYQNSTIFTLRDAENRTNSIDRELSEYYSLHFDNFNYKASHPYDLEVVKSDNYYLHLISKKLRFNLIIVIKQNQMLMQQRGILDGIGKLQNKNCTSS
ncbi:MAG: hypothetical protein H6567_06095 [Lewinellaceae bacterium]|nr:hypothetical protein [Lewinellaceae bacterium]